MDIEFGYVDPIPDEVLNRQIQFFRLVDSEPMEFKQHQWLQLVKAPFEAR